jgi:chromate reductase, NAD(P)H dehydrogenase (quinone)
MTTMIAGIAGSLRRDSVNRQLLHAAARALAPGVQLNTIDLFDHVPPFNEDWEATPAPLAVAELRNLISRADGLLIATPEYNGSIPGQLKNALDWASRPRGTAALQGKPTAVISASPGARGAGSAAADLRKILAIAGANVTATGLAVPRAFTQFRPDGQLADPTLDRRLRAVVYDLLAAVAHRQQAA